MKIYYKNLTNYNNNQVWKLIAIHLRFIHLSNREILKSKNSHFHPLCVWFFYDLLRSIFLSGSLLHHLASHSKVLAAAKLLLMNNFSISKHSHLMHGSWTWTLRNQWNSLLYITTYLCIMLYLCFWISSSCRRYIGSSPISSLSSSFSRLLIFCLCFVILGWLRYNAFIPSFLSLMWLSKHSFKCSW